MENRLPQSDRPIVKRARERAPERTWINITLYYADATGFPVSVVHNRRLFVRKNLDETRRLSPTLTDLLRQGGTWSKSFEYLVTFPLKLVFPRAGLWRFLVSICPKIADLTVACDIDEMHVQIG